MSVESSLDNSIEKAASALRVAAEVGITCEPVRLLVPNQSVATAYKIQQLNVNAGVDAQRKLSGRKIGLTSTAVQKQLGVDQPDYGALFNDMEYSDGATLDATMLLQPRVEAEVALVLDRDLDNGTHGFAEIIRAVAFVLPAIEVVDSRIANWDITLFDTIADNASCGAYVLGGQPRHLTDLDLRSISMSMTINSEVVSSGSGADCLGNPLNAARWLADVMSQQGTPLKAGDVLMTGALGPMQPLAKGDNVVADLGELGTVSLSMSGDVR